MLEGKYERDKGRQKERGRESEGEWVSGRERGKKQRRNGIG